MKPGRELDVEVGEKVMGLLVIYEDGETDCAPVIQKSINTGRRLIRADLVPHYSTDIATTLEALEKDDGAGWDFTLTRYAASSVPWIVEAHRHLDGLMISEAGETCALATCRMLLKTRSASPPVFPQVTEGPAAFEVTT